MKQRVTVFGSSVVDLMARTPHLPVPGETVLGSFFKQSPGGKGFNQGYAAFKAGADVAMISKIGRDPMASIPLNAMKEIGFSDKYMMFNDDVATGVALISVDEKTSQNEIVIVSGACGTITDQDIKSVEDVIKSSAYLLLQLEINQDANEKIAAFAKKSGVKVIVNTAPYQAVSDEFLNGLYLVTPNEVEAEELTGVKVTDLASADKAAEVFLKKGVRNVLITLGSTGAYVNSDGHSEIIPSYKVKAVDTTGAGDAFSGALLAALSEGKDLWNAAKFANAFAALSVQKMGTSVSMPTRAETDRFIAENQ